MTSAVAASACVAGSGPARPSGTGAGRAGWAPSSSASVPPVPAVAVGDEVQHLTPTQYKLLAVLVRQAGRIVTHRQLLQAVWGPAYGSETNYLRVHFAHIRRKLEPDPSQPRYFVTEPGMAASVGPIIFVIVVVGGMGSLAGAFIASLLIGCMQTFAVSLDWSLGGITIAQAAPVLPYLLMVLLLIFRPTGLMGTREG